MPEITKPRSFLDCNGEERICGAIKSPPDDRDYNIDMLVPPTSQSPLPKEFSIMRPAVIRNQGSVGSCVAFTIATAKEIVELMQAKSVNLSAGWIYGNRANHSWHGWGMWPREALLTLMDDGVPELHVFPWNIEVPEIIDLVAQHHAEMLPLAIPFRISAFTRLWTVEQVKQALIDLGPVSISYTLWGSFHWTGRDGIVPRPTPWQEEHVGGHAMVCTGWRIIDGVEYWIIVNSWGSWWGDNGLCYIETSSGVWNFDEAWSMTDNVYPAREDRVRDISIRPVTSKMHAMLDNNSFVMDVPVIFDGTNILVSPRFVSNSLASHVKWDPANSKIVITKDSRVITLTIGSTKITIGALECEMDVPPVMQGDTPMIPFKHIVEWLGYDYHWDPSESLARATIIPQRTDTPGFDERVPFLYQ